MQCECNASSNHSSFQCSKYDPNDVIFTAEVITYSDMETMEVIEIIQSWVTTQESVSLQGEVFHIDQENCPLVISTVDNVTCLLVPEIPLVEMGGIIIGVVSAALVCILLIFALLIILCCIARKRSSMR